MTTDQLPLPATACSPLPFSVDEDNPSTTILLFVRALAIRQARLDAFQPIEPANDNERGTVH
jgi:hypothetical protein